MPASSSGAPPSRATSAASAVDQAGLDDRTVTVTQCGRVCFGKRKIHLSTLFAGQNVGVKQVADRIWMISFIQYNVGFFDDETNRLEPVENPFQAKVLPMSPAV